jgi:hypothetical protein
MRSGGLKALRKVDETKITKDERFNKSYIARVKNRAMWESQKGGRSDKGFTGAKKVQVMKSIVGSTTDLNIDSTRYGAYVTTNMSSKGTTSQSNLLQSRNTVSMQAFAKSHINKDYAS